LNVYFIFSSNVRGSYTPTPSCYSSDNRKRLLTAVKLEKETDKNDKSLKRVTAEREWLQQSEVDVNIKR